jgi:hypothetical protein
MTLDLDALAVETFAPAPAVETPPAALAATVANCSAIDACPTRLCTSHC